MMKEQGFFTYEAKLTYWLHWKQCTIQVEGSPKDIEPLLLIIQKYMIKIKEEPVQPKKKTRKKKETNE